MIEILLRTSTSGLLLLLVFWLLRNGPAAHRVLAARAGLLAIIFSATGLQFHLPNPEPALVLAPGQLPGPGVTEKQSWIPLILWVLGALVALLRMNLGAIHLRRLWRNGSPAPEFSEGVAAKLADVRSPLVFGWPGKLLLPATFAKWDPRDRINAVQHELAHLRAKDPLWVAAFGLAGAIFWWQPVVRWICARHRRDIELAADQAVLAGGVDPADYAQTLLSLLRPAEATVACAAAGAGPLEERIRSVLSLSAIDRRFPAVAVPVVLAIIAVAGIGFTEREVTVRDAGPEAIVAQNAPQNIDPKLGTRTPKVTPATIGRQIRNRTNRHRPARATIRKSSPAIPVAFPRRQPKDDSSDPISKTTEATELPEEGPFGSAFPKLTTSDDPFGTPKGTSDDPIQR